MTTLSGIGLKQAYQQMPGATTVVTSVVKRSCTAVMQHQVKDINGFELQEGRMTEDNCKVGACFATWVYLTQGQQQGLRGQ